MQKQQYYKSAWIVLRVENCGGCEGITRAIEMNEMIEQFETLVKNEFDFLSSEYNFQITDVEKYFTYTSLLFETETVEVRFYFSLRDHEIRINCGLKKAKRNCDALLSNEDLLRLDNIDVSENSSFTVFTLENLKDSGKEISRLLQQTGRPYLLGEENAYVQLFKTQESLMKKYQLDMKLSEVRKQLEQVWKQQDYYRVVSLLKPYLSFLKQSEIQKYEFSLKYEKEIKAIEHMKLIRKVVFAIVSVISSAIMIKLIINNHLWLAGFCAFFLIVVGGIIECIFDTCHANKDRGLVWARIAQMRCPKCKSDEIKTVSAGLWDGIDEEGNDVNGTIDCGICLKCNAKLRSFNKQDWQQISEEEWEKEGLSNNITYTDQTSPPT